MNKTILFQERLKIAMKNKGFKQTNLVRLTCINKSCISKYCSGAYKPKKEHLKLLADALDVTEDWLLGYDETTINISLEETELIRKYRMLKNNQQNKITSIINYFAENKEKFVPEIS